MNVTRMIAALSTAMTLLAVAPSVAVAAEPLDIREITQFAREHVGPRMEAANLPGLVFVVADATGTIEGFTVGHADPATRRPMQLDTRLRVGSISKPVTAAVALELDGRGTIDLDQPLDAYLDIDLGDGHGPASTIRSLLMHRGGYPDAIIGTHDRRNLSAVDLGKWARSVAPRPIPPDVVASYSSVGYTLVGAAVEGATGTDFDAVARHLVLEPAGMTRATFLNPAPEDVALGHRSDGSSYPIDSPALWPASGLVASGQDIGRFMTALLDEDGPFASSTRDGMLTLRGPDPDLRGSTLGLTEWKHAERRVLYHEGNGIGTTSRMILLPGAGVGIFTAVNAEAMVGLGDPSVATHLTRELQEEIVARFFPGPGSLAAPEVIEGAVPTANLGGTYVPTRVDPDSVMRLEALISQTEVVETDDGLRLGDRTYQRIGPGRFRSGSATALFLEGPKGARFATFGGTSSFRRAAIWETLAFNLALLGGAVAAVVVGSVVSMAAGPRRLRILAASNLGSWSIAIVMLAIGLSNARVMELFAGQTLPLRVAAAASVLGLVSSAALGWTVVDRRADPEARPWPRRAATVASVAGIVLAGWFTTWGILPV